MTLRRKTLLTLGLISSVLIAAVCGATSLIFFDRFSDLENTQLLAGVERVRQAINNQLERMEAIARDYATRGDSFNFVAGREPDYGQKHLSHDTFRNFNIDVAVFMPLQGSTPVFAKSIEQQTVQETALALRIAGLMTHNAGLRYNADAVEGKSGILRVGTNFFLFALHPILPGSNQGPGNGTLLMARLLDQTRLAKLSGMTQLELTINGVAGDLPEDFSLAWNDLRHGGTGPFLHVLDQNTYAAYVPMLDQSRKPVALLRATLNRSILAHVRTAFAYLLIALLILGLGFLVVTMLCLDRLLLTRLGRLATEVNRVSAGSKQNQHMTVSGHDELSAVAQKINYLLNNLRSQVALEHDVASAQSAAAAKSTFLANMSHELRTPLNAIIGYSELLQDSAGDEGLSRLLPDLQKIGEAGKHLQSIISNVLDISKIEAGKMELEILPFDIHDIIHSVSDIVLVHSREKALHLLVNVNPEVPRHITGDAPRLRQILLNLLNNAVKFTERGEVELTVNGKCLAPPATGLGSIWELSFAVRDTGIGIPAQRFDRLFKAFSQVDASSSRKYGGTGLGLAISQQLCEMMGGRMWVESTEGHGSTFHFTLQTKEAVMNAAQGARAHA